MTSASTDAELKLKRLVLGIRIKFLVERSKNIKSGYGVSFSRDLKGKRK